MAFQGSLKELPLPDIIQLVSVSGKTGMFALTNGAETGHIFLEDGQIVHASAGEMEGEEAVYALAIWRDGDFVFTPAKSPPKRTIEKSNTNLLMEAARRIDEWQILSKRIPSTRQVPVFTEQPMSGSISLTPPEWSVVCRIDERRSIEDIALGLGMSAFEVSKVLFGLITSGLVVLREDLGRRHSSRLRRMSPREVGEVASRIHRHAQELLAGSDRAEELESGWKLSQAEMASGRAGDAVFDLIRTDERVIAKALGPERSEAFLARVEEVLAER